MKTRYETNTLEIDENDNEIRKPTGNYLIEEAHWLILIIEDVNFWICDKLDCYFSWILFPNILGHYNEDDGYYYTLREWYGGLSGIWHMYICNPIFQWCQKKKKVSRITEKKYTIDIKEK